MTQKKDAAKVVEMTGREETPQEAQTRASLISEKIEYWNRKTELLRKRTRFMYSHEKLTVALASIPVADDNGEFEKKEPMRLTISEGYKDEICKISNPVVLREVLESALVKIEKAVFELDEELIK